MILLNILGYMFSCAFLVYICKFMYLLCLINSSSNSLPLESQQRTSEPGVLKAHTMPSEAHLKNVYKESGTKTWSGSRLKIQNHRYTVGVLISCGTFEVFVGILGSHCVPICHVPVLINIIWTWNSFSSIFLLQAFSKIPEPIFSSMALTLRLFFSSKLIERTHFRAFIYPIPPTNSESFLQTEAKQLNLSAGVNEMLRVEWIWSHEKCL